MACWRSAKHCLRGRLLVQRRTVAGQRAEPPKPSRVGFIGIGAMGEPMALNLVHRGGFESGVLVFDANPKAMGLKALRDAGATVAASLRDFSTCEQIVLCLPDSPVVEEVLLYGPDALQQIVLPSTLIMDCSTTHPRTSLLAAQELPCDFIDAPVTGERKRAEQGTLTIMVGGKDGCYQRALPVLQLMAKSVVYLGGHGNGQFAKALNNCLYNINCAAMGEVLSLATRAGLDTAALSEVVSAGSGQSFGFDKFCHLVGGRRFAAPEHGYPMGSAFKDMQVVQESVKELSGCDLHEVLPVIAAAKDTYEKALQSGLAYENKGAMAKVYEAKFGVEVKH